MIVKIVLHLEQTTKFLLKYVPFVTPNRVINIFMIIS